MAFTNSSLVSYTQISPNRNSPRTQPISKITIHHCAAVMSVEQFGNLVANPSRQMSANYCIGNDGRIGLYCPEGDRSWCSSSPWNDHRAITIEVSNDVYGEPWSISTAAYNSLIRLCVDICKRNGIKNLEFTGNQNGSLTYHYMFSSTACLPVKRTELLTPNGWKLLSDIQIGDIVATVHIDDESIEFDEVQNIVPLKTQDTYIMRDFEATSDHRIMYYNQAGRQYIGQFKDLYEKCGSLYFSNAGQLQNAKGFGDLSLTELEFLIAVQADGHYMKDNNCYVGIEFHLKKERKIERITAILKELGYPCNVINQSDGTIKLRVYGKEYYQFCEKYLQDKHFTWEWLNMSKEQADFFLDTIQLYDGCVSNQSYSSAETINVDIVQAIASINGLGSKLGDNHTRVYFKKRRRSIGDAVKQRKPKQQVSCVTVRSGFILIRQHGRTTITGNCPGTWIKNHTTEICNLVNAQLGSTSTTQPTTSSGKFSTGDLVKIKSGARYYDGGAIPNWVLAENWYISSISGDRAVLGNNESKSRNIQSPINTSNLTMVKSANAATGTIKKLDKGTVIYDNPNGKQVGTIDVTTNYTIIEEKTVDYTKYGKLKSGLGWVIVERLKRTFDIKNASHVKELQMTLTGKGFDCGTADGIVGDKTINAMFQALCEQWLQVK